MKKHIFGNFERTIFWKYTNKTKKNRNLSKYFHWHTIFHTELLDTNFEGKNQTKQTNRVKKRTNISHSIY